MNAKTMLIAASVVALAGVSAIPSVVAEDGTSLVACVQDYTGIGDVPETPCQSEGGTEDELEIANQATECAMEIQVELDEEDFNRECHPVF